MDAREEDRIRLGSDSRRRHVVMFPSEGETFVCSHDSVNHYMCVCLREWIPSFRFVSFAKISKAMFFLDNYFFPPFPNLRVESIHPIILSSESKHLIFSTLSIYILGYPEFSFGNFDKSIMEKLG